MSAEPLLEVRKLSLSIGGKPIVKDVSFDVPRNTWVCLVGETGSGKSLTALSLARLSADVKAEGSVLWHDDDGTPHDLLRISEKELTAVRGKDLAYVFQDPHSSLNPVMTVGEQMVEAYQAHFRCKHKEAEKASLVCLSEMHLDAKRTFTCFPHELSGGMKQRVMIATALLANPRLLVADEPTTALDASVEHGIINLLADLRTEWPMSYLFITHNIGLASRVADVVYVMRRGEIVEKMSRGTKGFEPKEKYTRMLFAAGLEQVKPMTEIPV